MSITTQTVLCSMQSTRQSFQRKERCKTGCPLSRIFFILYIEILSAAILNDPDVTGIKVNEIEFKYRLFPDDATFAMDGSLKSFQRLLSI